MGETPSSPTTSTKLQRIAEMAKSSPELAFTTLAHHIDIAWLHEAHQRTRKDGARGVDGRGAKEYAKNLGAHLQSLLQRVKSGTYRAPPVRRAHIPKADGSLRPIGIPTFEDKVLQRAVAMLLEAIYEPSFHDFSYGFRPGRSAHQALEAVQHGAVRMAGGWVLEVDIRKFFDSVDHGHMMAILRRRVRDGVLLRLIGKWLEAGVLEGRTLSYPDEGTPQGGVISPILANIYLHEVFDEWFVRDVRPRMRGQVTVARYADDIVMVFSKKGDATRVLDVLAKRFGRFALELHPTKTRLLQFLRPDQAEERPSTFDLLGFTLYWGLSRRQTWIVKYKTAKDRLSRALTRIREWCRDHRHWSLKRQKQILGKKVTGHYAYYGVTSNNRSLRSFSEEVRRIWRYWLSRRSGRAYVSWPKMLLILKAYPLPEPRIYHRYGRAVNPCPEEPDAGIPHVRICGGPGR